MFALLTGHAHGKDLAIDAFYSRLEPQEPFRYKWKTDGQFREGTCTVGVFRWEVPVSEFGTNGLGRNFTGYCAEVLVPIVANRTYRFRINSLDAPENYNLAALARNADKERFGGAADRRARLVWELFARYFRDPVIKPVNPTDALALQVALWEVVQEAESADGDLKLDLFGGAFQANYPRAAAPAYVTRAQEYLGALTGGADALLVENPDLRGRELIWLQGIGNAEGTVAQSQFVLQGKGGVPPGSANRDPSVGALTGGGMGFVGSPANGKGGLGGIPPISPSPTQAGGPLSPADNSPDTGAPAPNPLPGGISQPPASGPLSLADNSPDTGLPVPSRPVPAPAGLVLGVVALITLGSWHVRRRLVPVWRFGIARVR